jgi:predicted GIY-YIG superfamily endonuclease
MRNCRLSRRERSSFRGAKGDTKAANQPTSEKYPIATWFVYMLRCADDTLYTGITNDLKRRCCQHNDGAASRYTRGRCPVQLVYQETHPSRSLALRREAAVKALSRRRKESLVALSLRERLA